MMTTIMTNDQKSKAHKQFYLSQQIISSYGPYLKTNLCFHFLFKEIQQKPALTVKGNENGGLLSMVVDKCSFPQKSNIKPQLCYIKFIVC